MCVPHSFQLSLIAAPMAVSLSSDPLLRITLLAEKQKHFNYVAQNSGGKWKERGNEQCFLSLPKAMPFCPFIPEQFIGHF